MGETQLVTCHLADKVLSHIFPPFLIRAGIVQVQAQSPPFACLTCKHFLKLSLTFCRIISPVSVTSYSPNRPITKKEKKPYFSATMLILEEREPLTFLIVMDCSLLGHSSVIGICFNNKVSLLETIIELLCWDVSPSQRDNNSKCYFIMR